MERRLAPCLTRMRIATVDVGTNTALLLVADLVDGRVVTVLEAEQFVRLGEGVDAEGAIRPAALERLEAALRAFRADAERLGAEAGVVAGTSAARDAANRDALVQVVGRAAGWPFEVLSGEEEARWGFVGAVSAFDDLVGEVAFVDVGGGSTEVVIGTPGVEPSLAYRGSLPVGSVRLTERCFSSLPPDAGEIRAARRTVASALAAEAVPVRPGTPLVGAAGTASVLARLHGAPRITLRDVEAWRDRLLGMTPAAVLALAPDVMAGRADVVGAAVLVLAEVMAHLGVMELRASPRGLRHGLALRAARG